MDYELPVDIQESLIVSRRVLANMIRMIDYIIGGALGHPATTQKLIKNFAARKSTHRIFPGMLQALGSSSNTLLSLSERPGLQSRDCFSICRSIGDTAAERAEEHANPKTFRDLNRSSAVGGYGIEKNKLLPGVDFVQDQCFQRGTGQRKGQHSLDGLKGADIVHM